MRKFDQHDSRLDAIGDLIDSIGRTSFATSLFGYFHNLVMIDHYVVFVISDNREPRTLATEGRNMRARWIARKLAHEYVSGQFVNDPFLDEKRYRERSQNVDHAATHAFLPSELPDTNYRRHFYDRPDISHEINFVERSGSDRFYLCLYRRSNSLFSDSEIAAIEAYAPLAIKATKKHLASERADTTASIHGPHSAAQRDALLTRVRNDLQFNSMLSPREADVCAHIATGYNIGAISLILGISQNTAATHRKRAYAKLEISSQNELFARYIALARCGAH